MGKIRDLQRALELAHYAARNRGALHVAVLGGSFSLADFQLDLRLLGAYGLRSVVVARWHGGAARDQLAMARRQGGAFELVDGDDELDFVLKAVRRHLEASRIPVVLLPDRPRAPSSTAEGLGAALAMRLGARRLLVVTSEAARLLGGETRPHLTCDEAADRMARCAEGERQTWALLLGAVEGGVPGVAILSGEPGAVFEELFTHQGAGVLIGGELTEEVRRAMPADAADISLLLRAEMERGVVRPVSDEVLLATVEEHLVYTIDGLVVGTARLAPYGAWAELSRFATLPRYRGRGRARQLGLALIDWGRTLGYSDLFALSIDERMWRFFESLDFEATERTSLPADWARGYDFNRPSRAFHRQLSTGSPLA